ncbi:cell wall-binding repeat-containing protein [Agromyces sp. LHK192]|uniref:cell wall-binding repeat-containing protein n=1 Tax=Agromyces sp. LHK192 TaxID=2498704 RepID=UPI000FD8DF11|nr:cell wall-binding repeat-containing protein [Agromyces sp. LHK192]
MITALVALATPLVLAPAPALADTGVRLSGTVLVETAAGDYAPNADVSVALYSLGGDGDLVYQVPVSWSGRFEMYGIDPGKYRLRYVPNNWNGQGVTPEWFGGTPHESQAQVIEVGPTDVTGLDGLLELGSSISGTISYTDGAEPRGAASAFLYDQVTGQWERFPTVDWAASDGTYSIGGLAPGMYALRFGDRSDEALVSTEYWDASELLYSSTPVELAADQHVAGHDGTLGPGGIWIHRWSGPDRFHTSVEISLAGYPEGSDAVFIANGLNFPDALSAGPAAARIGAPILLTMPDALPAVVAEEIGRLAPQHIYVVGGEPSVAAAVEQQLATYAPVERFGGQDRFETSRMIADAFWEVDGARTAYIATGLNFPDALSSAPAAANENAPVILVDGRSTQVDDATAELLERLHVTKTVVAGGQPSVSAGFATDLRDLPGMIESYRRSGSDRFATSVLTNERSFPVADAAFLATGFGFPDALAGAAIAGGWRAPLYLSMPSCVPVDVIEELLRLQVRDVFLLGGEPTLGVGVENLQVC